jgi:hypothetical protein
VDAPYEWMCVTRPGPVIENSSVSVSKLVPQDRRLEKEDISTSPKLGRPESDGNSKRLHSPSTGPRKTRAADKKSTSGESQLKAGVTLSDE